VGSNPPKISRGFKRSPRKDFSLWGKFSPKDTGLGKPTSLGGEHPVPPRKTLFISAVFGPYKLLCGKGFPQGDFKTPNVLVKTPLS